MSDQDYEMHETALTNAERQMIAILRREATDGFRLEIALQDGAWEIKMTAELKTLSGDNKTTSARGVGADFDRAWDNVTGLIF
jgi:hypothetical protein